MSFALKSALLAIVRAYQRYLSPFIPASCRYYPTCSEYMLTAIEHHGAARGVWLGLKRIGRCHPLGGSGYDPVPGSTNNNHTAHTLTDENDGDTVRLTGTKNNNG
jgi:putative membrane protein insertion efficiency factor